MEEKIILSIIIVNYNVRDFLMHALESIQSALKNISHEIYVVDNASVDGSVEMVKNRFSQVKIITNSRNIGFAAANNMAIRESSGEYIVMINPDTVVQEDTFSSLIRFMENNPGTGVASCKILNPDGSFSIDSRHSIPTPMTAFWKLIGLNRLFPKNKVFGRYNLTFLDENITNCVDAISGSFMFIRHQVIEDVGLLDEDYFMYCEDVDYCYRVNKSGWKIYYVPESSIIHYKGESTKKNNLDYVINFNRSLYIFYKKHFHKKYFAWAGWIIVLGIFFRAAFIYVKIFFITHFSFILDLFLINMMILLTFFIRFELKSGFTFNDFFNHYIVINLLATGIFSGVAFSLDLYRKYKFSLVGILRTNIATFFILSGLVFFMKKFAFSRMVVIISALFSTVFMIGWRILIRQYWHGAQSMLSKNIWQKKTVLVGTDKSTENLIDKMKHYVRTGFDLIGLITLTPENVGQKIKGIPVVATLDKMTDYIRMEKVDQVIFSTNSISYEMIIKTMSKIGNSGVEYKIVPRDLEVIIGRASVERFTDYPLIDIDYAIGKAYNRVMKRALDLFLSASILVLSAPIWISMLLIRWKKMRHIPIWGETGEKLNISQYNNKPLKGWFNKLQLIFYIFIGRLSFVGAPIRQLTDKQPLYYYKPGLFGLLQLNYSRIASKEEEERYELYYLKNQNIWLDLEIILKSLFHRSR